MNKQELLDRIENNPELKDNIAYLQKLVQEDPTYKDVLVKRAVGLGIAELEDEIDKLKTFLTDRGDRALLVRIKKLITSKTKEIKKLRRGLK